MNRIKKGEVSCEVVANVAASKAWELYGTLELPKFIERKLAIVHKVEVLQGDGGVGTIVNVIFVPGIPGLTSHKEMYSRVDNEKRIKVKEIIDDACLDDHGFESYRVRFEIIERECHKCVIKSTIEYELTEELVYGNVSDIVKIKPWEDIAMLAALYLEGL